ncbi:hypothetical protein Tsubulata_032062 [Turnera subulata]|uniref:Uncharacterized protein n=1 Tax=Turnera subulata TaxID=218843 RepID=A0A9Q0J6R9_9ROSI|nr:hypothetical protein Tsubulata_032062 [Turnera subulata]
MDTTSLSQVVFSFYPSMELYASHFLMMMEFLAKFNHPAITLKLLWSRSVTYHIPDNFKDNVAVPSLPLAFIEKLRHRYETRDCCSYTHIRCWRHDLEDFEMECLGQNGDRKALPKSLNSMQCLAPEDKICFRLRWRTM